MAEPVKAADALVSAWLGPQLTTFPPAPETVEALYATHLAIQQHPLVTSSLGGHAGFKLGAIGGAGAALPLRAALSQLSR